MSPSGVLRYCEWSCSRTVTATRTASRPADRPRPAARGSQRSAGGAARATPARVARSSTPSPKTAPSTVVVAMSECISSSGRCRTLPSGSCTLRSSEVVPQSISRATTVAANPATASNAGTRSGCRRQAALACRSALRGSPAVSRSSGCAMAFLSCAFGPRTTPARSAPAVPRVPMLLLPPGTGPVFLPGTGPVFPPGTGPAPGSPAAGAASAPGVAQDLPDHVAPRDAGHPAAAVRGGSGLVEAAYRGAQVGVAGGGPAVEHLPRGQLAVEDVAADQTVLGLHPVWTDDLPADDR